MGFGDWMGVLAETAICGYFAYAVVRVLAEIEKRKGGTGMGEISGDARAEPAMRVMRAALTMRQDRVVLSIIDLDGAQLQTLRAAAELITEESAKEIIRRRGL